MPRSEANLQREASAALPVRSARVGERTYYRFEDKWFWDNDDLTADEVHALLVTRQHRETARIERAQAMVALGERPVSVRRGAIPQDVQQLVYLRDEGRCHHCGSTTEMQFDDMIPLAMGDSSEDVNLQLLCGPCNRRMGAGLTIR